MRCLARTTSISSEAHRVCGGRSHESLGARRLRVRETAERSLRSRCGYQSRHRVMTGGRHATCGRGCGCRCRVGRRQSVRERELRLGLYSAGGVLRGDRDWVRYVRFRCWLVCADVCAERWHGRQDGGSVLDLRVGAKLRERCRPWAAAELQGLTWARSTAGSVCRTFAGLAILRLFLACASSVVRRLACRQSRQACQMHRRVASARKRRARPGRRSAQAPRGVRSAPLCRSASRQRQQPWEANDHNQISGWLRGQRRSELTKVWSS